MASDSESISISPSQLDFDPKNPRFADAEALEKLDDESIIKFYLAEVDLRELLDSITASGFVDFDPMLVMPGKRGRYTVLEGNRRLAALRLLHSAPLAKRLHVTDITMTQRVRASINKISVRVMPSKKAARAYIGFKHINGPHKWDSMAKAQYATEWLREGASLQTVAKTLGDRNFLVRRLIFGYLVMIQAENNGWDIQDRFYGRFAFSHLYTALTRPGFRDYLGLDANDLDFDPKREPIKRGHIRGLMQVMDWLYGSESRELEPLIRSQNPDLNRLNEVLQKKAARQDLFALKSLDAAYESIVPRTKRFSDALLRSLSHAEEALSLVTNFDGSLSLLDSAASLRDVAATLIDTMERRGKKVSQGRRKAS